MTNNNIIALIGIATLSLTACLPTGEKTIKFSKEENALYDRQRQDAIVATNTGRNRFVDYTSYPADAINLTAKDFENDKVRAFSQKIRQIRFHGCIRECVALMEAEYARILKLGETERRCYGTAWHGLTQFNHNANFFEPVYHNFQRHVTGVDDPKRVYKIWSYELGKDMRFVRNAFSLHASPAGDANGQMSERVRHFNGGVTYRPRFFIDFDKHNCPVLQGVDDPVLWQVEIDPTDLNPADDAMRKFFE